MNRVPAETKGAVFSDTPVTVMIMGRAAKGNLNGSVAVVMGMIVQKGVVRTDTL